MNQPKITNMELSKIRKTTITILFLILCAFMAYFQVITSTLNNLKSSGFDESIIYLLLTIPVITLLVSFFRTVIGISIGTIYIPIIIILTALSIGLNFTVITLLLCLFLAVVIKYLISDYHFHFGSKISIIISLVTFGLILILPILTAVPTNQNLALISYGALIISVINEKFFNYKITKTNFIGDIKQILKTLLLCIVCYFILGGTSQLFDYNFVFPYIKDLILRFPDLIIIIALLLNIIIGQYTGLRLDEIIRFRKLIFK